MRAYTPILRLAPLFCILATFPALGQVENASDAMPAEFMPSGAVQSSDMALRARGPSGLEIRAPRLLASEPRAERLSLLDFPGAGRAGEGGRSGLANVEERGPEPTHHAVGNPDPLDRISALSAVTPPPAAPPEQTGRMMDGFDSASDWAAIISEYLRTFWRQIGLVAAMALAAGLLFWRLGERSRADDPVVVADEVPVEAHHRDGDAYSEPVQETAVAVLQPGAATLMEAVEAMKRAEQAQRTSA